MMKAIINAMQEKKRLSQFKCFTKNLPCLPDRASTRSKKGLVTKMLKKEVEDLYFNYQPIVKVVSTNQYEIYSYEVLLRSKKKEGFPGELFTRLIETNEGNHLLLERTRQILKQFLCRHQKPSICLNIHPQQLGFPSTWEFLERMKEFNERLIIEITELPPQIAACQVAAIQGLTGAIEKIKKYGYRVALDDVSTGQNTLMTAVDNLDHISWIKFSLLPFRGIDRNITLHFLKGWQQLAKKHCLLFIVEGVESGDLATVLSDNQMIFQQGYFWGKGQPL